MRSRSDAKFRDPAASSASSRWRRDSTIPCVSRNRDVSVSGGLEISFWNVSTVQEISPLGGPLTVRGLLPRGLGLLLRLPLLDDVLGRLRDDAPRVVEPAPPRAPRDLLELADGEEPHLRPVELRELREEDRPDRDVHADAERVGPADDVEEPLLRELLDEEAVLREEPGVVDADPEREEPPELLAVGRREADPGDDLPDLLPLLAASRSSRS